MATATRSLSSWRSSRLFYPRCPDRMTNGPLQSGLNNYPPPEVGVLPSLAPQRGLFATATHPNVVPHFSIRHHSRATHHYSRHKSYFLRTTDKKTVIFSQLLKYRFAFRNDLHPAPPTRRATPVTVKFLLSPRRAGGLLHLVIFSQLWGHRPNIAAIIQLGR